MSGTLGWILFVLTLIWFVFSYRLSHKKRLRLNYYVVYLLLNDAIREKHKMDFEGWLQNAQAGDASSLTLKALTALEDMANRLAVGDPANPASSSVLGAHAMIWNFKKGDSRN